MIKHIARKLICLIPRGLTVTNSALITKTAHTSDSRITIECRNKRTSARNIFELLSIGMKYGDPVAISACGEDAEETLKNIGRLLNEDILNPGHYNISGTAIA